TLLLLSLTGFNLALELSLEASMLFEPVVVLGALGLCVLIGLLSGLYPSFYLSSIAPTQAIYGSFGTSRAGIWTRRALVGCQFVLSIGIVILTLFMQRQIEFMRNKDLGFKKENVVTIRMRGGDVLAKLPAFKEELLRSPEVISVSTGQGRPGSPSGGLYTFEGEDGMEEHNFAVIFAHFGYLETLGFEIVEGRDFDKSFPSDPGQAVIVNETLARFMGWEDPIGKRVKQFTNLDGQVIGVVKDFHFASLHNRIEPILIRMIAQPMGSLFVRLRGNDLVRTMGFLEDRWAELNPNRPFIYSFLDEAFDRQYDADRRQNRLVQVFSVMCILISCLGLLGLSSFTALRRTKEVAIRKVLGASSAQIVLILFREIFALIVLATVVAIPVSLLFIQMWLGKFAYQTGISPILFIATGVGAVLVAFLTASFHSMKAALSNPTDNLRYE
ncbi:MAG: FtsX-like permease family protein, partial [Candidatus Aminicenantaceae bacterium]